MLRIHFGYRGGYQGNFPLIFIRSTGFAGVGIA